MKGTKLKKKFSPVILKKEKTMELPKTYNPKEVEKQIYELWEKSGFFNPDNLPGKRKNPYCIIMPPPNANGSLHAGHAVFITLEDILIRYNRMRGKSTLWLPGADHGGFETQVVFEKKLEKVEEDIKHGRNLSPRFKNMDEAIKFLKKQW